MHVPKYFLLINLQSVALQLYQKRGSGTGVLMFNNKINPLSLSGNSIRSGCQMQLKVQPVNSHS